MEGQDFSILGVVEGKDDFVIVDEHRVQKDFDEPLLAIYVGVVHVCELVQEEPDVFLLQTQLLLQLGRRQSHPEFFFLLLQLVHAVLGAFVEDAGLDGPEEVGDGFLRFRQCGLEGIGIAGVRILGDIVLIGAFRNELQKLLTANQIAQMLQHQMLDPVLPDGPFGAELLLFGAADVVVVLHPLLAGAADTGHVCAAFAAENFAEQQEKKKEKRCDSFFLEDPPKFAPIKKYFDQEVTLTKSWEKTGKGEFKLPEDFKDPCQVCQNKENKCEQLAQMIMWREVPESATDQKEKVRYWVSLVGVSGPATLALTSLLVDDQQKKELLPDKMGKYAALPLNNIQTTVRETLMEHYKKALEAQLEKQNIQDELLRNEISYATRLYLSTVLYQYFFPFLSKADEERICNGMVTLLKPMMGMAAEILLIDEDLGL